MVINARLSLCVFVDGGQPEGHVGAGRREHHVLGIKLYTLDRGRVVAWQDANFVARISVPNMYSAVGGAAEDKLWIRAEARLDCNALVVEVSGERLHWCAMERVDQPDDAAVGRDQNGFSVAAELEPRPVALFFLRQFERGEGSLIETTQVVEFDALGVNAGSED